MIEEKAQSPINTENISATPWYVDLHIDDPEKTKYEMKKDGTLESGVDSGLILPDTLGELKYILQDLLAGDSSVMNTPELQNINFANIVKAIEWLGKANDVSDFMKSSLLTEGWRLNFKCKPPTPSEFLTEKYLGPTAEHIYPFIRDIFIEFWDPMKPYRTLVLTPHIGFGKLQPLDSKVYIDKDHFKYIKDIEPGDKVLAPSGEQVEVKGTIDWPDQEIYELEMDNGKTLKCGLHHLHYVSYRKNEDGEKIWENVETEFLLQHPELDFEFKEVEVNENATEISSSGHNIFYTSQSAIVDDPSSNHHQEIAVGVKVQYSL